MRGLLSCAALVIVWAVVSVALASPLDGTQWDIKLRTADVKTTSEDRVRFEKGRFTSPLFRPKGFPASNYTLTEEKQGPVIWETMQTSETEGTLSWRGELGGDSMRGVASWRKPGGTVIDYTFTGRKVTESAAPKTQPKAESKPQPKAPARSR
jgi:hypothetical protein